jgi:tetratricopeptide (TPR) repeat protein
MNCQTCGKKAKRTCIAKDGVEICFTCCAATRGAGCVACVYYSPVHDSRRDKNKHGSKHTYAGQVKPALEETLRNALKMIDNDQIVQAQTLLDTAAAADSSYYLLEYARGMIFLKQSQWDEGITCLDRALEKHPYFTEAEFNKGLAFGRKNDIPNMIRCFQVVLEMGARSDDLVLWARKHLRDLERVIRKSDGIDLDTFIAAHDSFDRGIAYMNTFEWARAIIAFERCVRINPDNPKPYANIGLCQAKLGNIPKAVAALDSAIAIDPSYEPALLNREAIISGYIIPEGKIPSVDYTIDYKAKTDR